MDYQKYLSWTYFGDKAYDKEQFLRLKDFLYSSSINMFIDVGASHGVYSYHANSVLENSKIVAIEADPTRFSVLKKNVDQWLDENPSRNEYICINAAASDADDAREGNIVFFVTDTQISGGLFAVQERSDDYKATSVPVIQLDDLFDPSARTFIKIDVEGAELRVLRGASKYIKSKKAYFLTEISWFGDRQRGTGTINVLLFALRNGLGVARWGRSNYLLSPEESFLRRFKSFCFSFPPLFARYLWNRFMPRFIRLVRERRLNKKRIGRYQG